MTHTSTRHWWSLASPIGWRTAVRWLIHPPSKLLVVCTNLILMFVLYFRFYTWRLQSKTSYKPFLLNIQFGWKFNLVKFLLILRNIRQLNERPETDDDKLRSDDCLVVDSCYPWRTAVGQHLQPPSELLLLFIRFLDYTSMVFTWTIVT